MTNNTQNKWKIDQRQEKNKNDVAYNKTQAIIQLYPTKAECPTTTSTLLSPILIHHFFNVFLYRLKKYQH